MPATRRAKELYPKATDTTILSDVKPSVPRAMTPTRKRLVARALNAKGLGFAYCLLNTGKKGWS